MVAEQLLNRADVVAVLEQVGGEGVAEGVTGDALGDAGELRGLVDGMLQAGRVEVMAAEAAGERVDRQCGRREDVLPDPVVAGIGQLAVEGIGELDGARAGLRVAAVEALDVLQMVK